MKTYKLYTLLALLGAMSFCTSCEDDEVVKTPLGTTSISSANATVSSLTFSWEAVSGATQYAYELRDPDEALVKGDVTTGLMATFTGLKDNTTYTLTVWSYAALSSDKTTSPVAKLTATTAKIVPLEVPAPSSEMQNGQMVLSWDAVDNASYYSYQLYSLEDDVETEITDSYTYDTSVAFDGLALGTYRFYIQAMSENEAYSNSEIVKIDFERTKLEQKRIKGTFTGMNGATGSADLVSYDDGSYTIEAFHGAQDYNLDFAVDPSNAEVKILNGSESGGYNSVWMDASYYLAAYCSGGYSAFEGDMKRGKVWFYTYYYDKDGNFISEGDYDFVWGAPAVSLWSAEGQFVITGYEDSPWNATIEANADGSYTIKDWFEAPGYDLTFTVEEDGVHFDTYTTDQYGYYIVPIDADGGKVYIYPDPSYTLFSGDVNGGYVKFYEGSYNQYITFTWGAGTVTGGGATIDDLVGTYKAVESNNYFFDYNTTNDWVDYSGQETDVTITKVDDTTIIMKNFYGWGTDLTGTVNLEAKTITFDPQDFSGFTFCLYDKPSEAVVATFDDNFTITVTNWTLSYSNYSYVYAGASSVLTKQ